MQPKNWPKPPAPTEGTEEILAWLHTLEFQFSERHAWPWHRWRDCAPETRLALQKFATSILCGNPLLNAARTLRFPETGQTDAPTSTAPAGTSPHAALETCMMAFSETRFADVETIAAQLMAQIAHGQSTLFTAQASLQAQAYSLLLEMWWFAVYRQGMPEYVKAPSSLLTRLEAGAEKWMEVGAGLVAKSTGALLTANHLALRGDMDAAIALYKDVAHTPGYKAPVMPQALVVFNPHDTEPDSTKWYAQQSIISHHMAVNTQGRHAILVSCDRHYLHEYGALFAALVQKQKAGDLLHFHLINCDASDAAILQDISVSTGIAVSHSFEHNRLFGAAPYRAADIASTARYVYLPDYLDHYASVTISDIDGWPKVSGDALQAFGHNDLLISSWIWRKNTGFWRLPWSNVSAGLLSVRASAGGKRFAATVSHYIQHAIRISEEHGTSSYFADQAGLFLTLRQMQAKGTIQLGFLGGGFGQSSDNSFYARHRAKRAAMEAQLKNG